MSYSNHRHKNWSLLVKRLDNQPTKRCCFLFNKYSTKQTINATQYAVSWLFGWWVFGWVIVPVFIMGRTRENYHMAVTTKKYVSLDLNILCVSVCVFCWYGCVYLVFVAQCWHIQKRQGESGVSVAWFHYYYPTVAWPACLSHTHKHTHIVSKSSALCWNIFWIPYHSI